MFEGKSDDNTDIEIIRKKTEPEIPPLRRRQTYYIRVELIEKLKAYAYWERRKMSEVVNMVLEEFFKDQEVKKIPRRK